jgi:hypothetical protein
VNASINTAKRIRDLNDTFRNSGPGAGTGSTASDDNRAVLIDAGLKPTAVEILSAINGGQLCLRKRAGSAFVCESK